jgi:hypothetical protein
MSAEGAAICWPVLLFISEDGDDLMIFPLSIPLGKQGSGGNPSEPRPQQLCLSKTSKYLSQ